MKKLSVKTRKYTFAELMQRLTSGAWYVHKDRHDHFTFIPVQYRGAA